jgi:hypothetical protein
MRKNSFFSLCSLILLSQLSFAQPIVSVDAVALLNEMPPPCSTLPEAYARVYPNGSDSPNTLAFYQTWTQKLENYIEQSQNISANFYRQNPMGYNTAAAQPMTNNVSPAQKAAMDNATREMAQKMLSDPAFAQKFAQMSEAEQQAYIAQQLSKNGIKPATGTPNSKVGAPAGMDIDWMGMTTTLMQSMADMSMTEAQGAVQERYAQKHEEVQNWADAEIKKLPLISMGEYGRDHDPAKVKAIQLQARNKHAEVASAMLKEMLPLLAQFRKTFSEKISALNAAFKKVEYGKTYNFGLFYNQVLQAQAFMLTGQHSLLSNEIAVMEECARWERERKQP